MKTKEKYQCLTVRVKQTYNVSVSVIVTIKQTNKHCQFWYQTNKQTMSFLVLNKQTS